MNKWRNITNADPSTHGDFIALLFGVYLKKEVDCMTLMRFSLLDVRSFVKTDQ